MANMGRMSLSLSKVESDDLDVVNALLSMPTTPTLQATAPQNIQMLNDEDMDIFTMLLNEMDSTPRPMVTTPVPILQSTSSMFNLPTLESSAEPANVFTWADALNSELLAGSFYLNDSSSTNHMKDFELPQTPNFSNFGMPTPSSSNGFSRNVFDSNLAKSPSPPPPPLASMTSHQSKVEAKGSKRGSNKASLSGVSSTATASSTSATMSGFHRDSLSPVAFASASTYSSGVSGVALSSASAGANTLRQIPQSKSKRKQQVIDSTHSSDGEGDSSAGDAKLSPKSHAIREKNREAVRKCRQKKKEREEALNDRIRLLEAENEEIRVQLRLGSEDRVREMEMEANRRAKRLEELLALSDQSPNSPEVNEQLREACASYMAQSKERNEDRSAALSGLLSRVFRLIEPTLFAKFYMWSGTAKDDYYTNPNGLWASISGQMNLTPTQTEQLSVRREKLQRLRAQVMDVGAKLSEFQANVTLKEKLDVDGLFFKNIQSIMTPRQLAKFILWIRKDPAVHQVTNATELLSSFLDRVIEPPAPNDFAHQSKARDEAKEQAVNQGKKSRLEQARERIIILTKGLWDAPKETLESIAQQGLTPNVTLIDPNNGGEYHGIAKTLQYVHRIRLAFGEKITVDLREMSLTNDKARATWVLQGTYRGKLGSHPNSSDQKHLKHVSFVIVCTYTFQPGSTLIREMLVAWDAIGLMRQIGLLNNGGKAEVLQSTEPMAPPPPKRLRLPTLRFEESQQLRQSRREGLARMFAASSGEEMLEIAKTILHTGCVFQDSYMGFEFRGWDACVKYAQKVRSPFPTLAVTGVKASENEGAALGSPIRLDWTIRAKYSGPLVSAVTDCSFNAVLFVTFDDTDHTIDSVHFSWNAQRLMDQLGIQRRS